MAQNESKNKSRSLRSKKSRRNGENKRQNRSNAFTHIYFTAGGIRSPFPDRYRTKIFLNVPCQVREGTAPATYFTIKHNSIVFPFDTPNPFPFAPGSIRSPSTTLPNFVDTFSTIYERYCVLGSKISVEMLPTSAADDASYCISAAFPGAAALNIDDAASQPHSRGPILAQASRMGGKANIYVSTKALASKDPINDDQYSGSSSLFGFTDPPILYRWDLTYRTLTNASVTATISVMIRLEYDVEFYTLNTNGGGGPLFTALHGQDDSKEYKRQPRPLPVKKESRF